MPMHVHDSQPRPPVARRLGWSLLAVAMALGPRAAAQPMRDLVDAALDQRIIERFEIHEQPLRDALAQLEQPTGLRFELDERALEWMPYGAQTQVNIVLEDVSARQGLARILDGLGLALRVADDKVLIEPAPWLDRLGRRLTIAEVQLLQKLASGPWSAHAADIPVEFQLPPEGDPHGDFAKAMTSASGSNALHQLEAATQRLGWQWVPHEQSLVIYSAIEDVHRRLGRPIDIRYQRVPLDQVLVDLGRRVGVTVHFEPGSLERVAAHDRAVDLIQRQTSVRQVLELLSGRTGLWYEVTPEGIIVGAEGAETGKPDRARVAAILRVPVGDDGTTIDFLIREDELPEEFWKLREKKLPEVIELLRTRLAE